ncbi:MAG: CRTAC1 family protein [Planctomycetota bacterium]
MAERLAKLARESDPVKNPFLNPQRVEMFRKQAAAATELAERIRLRMMVGYELVLSGKTQEAVDELTAIRSEINQPSIRLGPKTVKSLHDLMAIAYLRLGEQENCIAKHSQDSCLMPIRGSGVHTLPRGSRAAIDELNALLETDPKDLKSRWLLNLAYMTLGEYPEKVPPTYTIPPRVFESEIEFPRFYDVAPQAGVATVDLSGGCITEDLDGDGDLDIMASSWGLMDQIRYYRNNSDGTFSDQTEAAGLSGEVGGLNITHADYDNDGDADVLILRGAWLRDQGRLPNSLLRNNGKGYFEDVTEEAGLLSFHPTQAGSWADYDNDGWLDLFIGNESSAEEVHPCELYHNNGDGTFTDVAKELGVAHIGFVKAAVWGDYNNDGRPDLYLSCLNAPNVLFKNNGINGADPAKSYWPFTDETAAAGMTHPLRSFPAWFWDYDNDGWLDILVASFSVFLTDSVHAVAADYLDIPNDGETPRLYHNNKDGSFADVTKSVHLDKVLLAMGANFGDLDNDGWLDCYFGTGDPLLATLVPNRMFRNNAGKDFQDVTTAGGFGHLQKGHGVAFADLDNDGDQDIYAVMGGAYVGDVFQNALFENPGFGNHWITLRLEGTKSNRSAIGARIKVSVVTSNGSRDIHAVVSSGGSFGSSSLQQEIGLGQATMIENIDIRWPSGMTQSFRDLGIDGVYHIREGDAKPTPITLKPFDLSPGNPGDAPCPHHPK